MTRMAYNLNERWQEKQTCTSIRLLMGTWENERLSVHIWAISLIRYIFCYFTYYLLLPKYIHTYICMYFLNTQNGFPTCLRNAWKNIHSYAIIPNFYIKLLCDVCNYFYMYVMYKYRTNGLKQIHIFFMCARKKHTVFALIIVTILNLCKCYMMKTHMHRT